MDVHLWINFIILFILLCLSAFFSSAETALTAVNRIKIETLLKEEPQDGKGPEKRRFFGSSEKKRAERVLRVIDDKHKMLSAILIGNNLVNIMASSIATVTAVDIFGSIGVGIATGALTLLVLIFGEITPKSIATLEPTKHSLRVSGIIWALMCVLTPVIFVLNLVVKGIMKLLRMDNTEDEGAMTSEEVKLAVAVSNEKGTIEDDEKEYIENVFDFSDALVREVMTPRIDMTVIKKESTFAEVKEVFAESMYTRYPVCGENTDDILGIINMKDLLLYDDSTPFDLGNYIREAFYTFETKNTADLFEEMRKGSISMAIVLDEYGDMAGLVTLEDLLEELVGEIRDEFDEDEVDDIIKLSNREFEVQGSANLEDLCDDLPLDFESDDYDTIGGYLTGLFDHFPKAGETYVTQDGVMLRVVTVSNNRVGKIRIRFPEEVEY